MDSLQLLNSLTSWGFFSVFYEINSPKFLFVPENGYNTSSDSQDDSLPVPPPRHKRKAKKTKKSGTKEKRALEAKRDDLGWYSTSTKFGIPLVPTLSGIISLSFNIIYSLFLSVSFVMSKASIE